jgi:tetratricopeptide (TPR) repeat protein/transcription elongation factor Elf1
MLNTLKNLLSSKKPQEEEIVDPDGIIFEHWEADFSQPENIRFALLDIASHKSFIENKSLVLAMKKPNCLAWIESPEHRYHNFVIQANMRIDALGGYAAAGISFRMVDEVTNYTLLVSSKGFFRVDVIRNRNPLALLGWTEIPGGYSSRNVHIEIIASGNHFIFILNNEWAAELYDDTIPEGTVGFASASYSAGENTSTENPEVSKAYLASFVVESREAEVGAIYDQWDADEKKDPETLFRLAETYFAMGKAEETIEQLWQIWDEKEPKYRDEELLLAAKAAVVLAKFDDAETYLAAISASPETELFREAALEKAKLLYVSAKYKELKKHIDDYSKKHPNDITLLTLQGHAYWNLKDFSAAAAVYEQAAKFDEESGLPAKNAGSAYDMIGDKKKAAESFLKAGRIFLRNDNYADLETVVPRLIFLDPKNWEVHALAGKLAFAFSDWHKAEAELHEAEKLRMIDKSKPKEDPALVFLWGLLLIQQGRRQEALSFLEKAITLDDEHSVFHFKLAETRFMLFNNPQDDKMKKHLSIALKKNPADGWTANLAARIALAAEDTKNAEKYVLKAAENLGDIPAVKVNKALLLFQNSLHDEALELLESNRHEDPEGMMASCAGNILSKLNRHEEAEAYYRKALSIDQDNLQYMTNLASCLIQAGLYSEAETLLKKVNGMFPSADVLEMIAFIATRKAEYPRAEELLHSALELDGQNVSVMISLGWIYANTFRWKETEEVLNKLASMNIDDRNAKDYQELKTRYEETMLRTISCSGSSCKRNWKVSKEEIDVPSIRLFSEPPDELPAGTCPKCKKTFCIGCAKKSIDDDGRFVCKKCGKNLKLTDSGLKKIINDWAAQMSKEQKAGSKEKKRKKKS